MVKITDPAFFAKCTEQKFVEFYDEDKQTLLNHWTEKFDPTNNEAIFWVKVPNIPANGTKTIYLKINTSRTEDLSNGDNVFEFFDDFEILDTSKWSVINNVVIKQVDSITVAEVGNDGELNSVLLNTTGKSLRFTAKLKYLETVDGTTNTRAGMQVVSSGLNDRIYLFVGGTVSEIRWNTQVDGTWQTEEQVVSSSSPNTWYVFEIVKIEDIYYVYVYDVNLNLLGSRGGRTVKDEDMSIRLISRSNQIIQVDYVFVRKYTSPEPTVTVIPIVATATLEFKKRVAECIVTENCKINEADPKLELYDSGGNLIKTLPLADKHIFKDEANNRVVVQFLFVDDSSDSYTSGSQKLKFTKDGAEYVAFEASETLEKSADEPLPLRWEIYIPYTLDIELEGEY